MPVKSLDLVWMCSTSGASGSAAIDLNSTVQQESSRTELNRLFATPNPSGLGPAFVIGLVLWTENALPVVFLLWEATRRQPHGDKCNDIWMSSPVHKSNGEITGHTALQQHTEEN